MSSGSVNNGDSSNAAESSTHQSPPSQDQQDENLFESQNSVSDLEDFGHVDDNSGRFIVKSISPSDLSAINILPSSPTQSDIQIIDSSAPLAQSAHLMPSTSQNCHDPTNIASTSQADAAMQNPPPDFQAEDASVAAPTVKAKHVAKPHLCLKCDKKFSSPSKLKAHDSTHQLERLWKCTSPGCGKSYKQKNSLTKHCKNKDHR